MILLRQFFEEFADYQLQYNTRPYARAVCRQIAEFISICEANGAVCIEHVRPEHIAEYLSQIDKDAHPAAWRHRYYAVQVFFSFAVFTGRIPPEQNPFGRTPDPVALTNKRLLSQSEFLRLLAAMPNTHLGVQDQLCSWLLWFGRRLRELSDLRTQDVPQFPEPARQLALGMLAHRRHVHTAALFVDTLGRPRRVHGQKFNRRLQKYAQVAEIPEPERVTAKLLRQSGAYHQFCAPRRDTQ
ncbi:MAG: hypothetical protein K6T76_04000 [Alicyclobacillus mali]|uniref:tyrosine-type recombinase/integrase n=1 Tax=Alicyclobacillus mali (ex Roth et al. 2021) TaxID=1123961 RepID=UPI0023F4AE7E|nr:hypothetical protein [Alicyclobacillus mali (ex Roth et al. 2021)]MCL6488085.1 hypothetical protein [Alicyclobacillus mali (ex Roth et al. 2021)]